MPNPFDSRDARVSRSIDKTFGEAFVFHARGVAGGDVDLPRTTDTTRADFTVTGIWEGPSKSMLPAARGGSNDKEAHHWDVSKPSVSVAEAALVWMPVGMDTVTRLFDGSTYEISKPYNDGMGRALFRLTSKKR